MADIVRKIKPVPKASLPKLIAVVGPTASGKTDLALALAKRFKGEIISADSRQFYRGTEIGSGIPEGEWKVLAGRKTYFVKGIPHHLTAFLLPSKTFTAAQFKDHVIRISRDIVKRGHVPILAGGTGLFIRAVVDNLEIPEVPADPAFRAKMEKRPIEALWRELQKKDPVYAARIPKHNRRYTIRALEVIRATGKPFSEQQTKGKPLFRVLQIGLTRDREALYRRIHQRVDRMMAAGLLSEAKRLGKRYGWSIPAMTGLGHRQLGEFLEGKTTLPDAVDRIKSDTRHYAKRQITWFKRDATIHWVKDGKTIFPSVKRFLEEK